MKQLKKSQKRLAVRLEAYEHLKATTGYHKPGSLKKVH